MKVCMTCLITLPVWAQNWEAAVFLEQPIITGQNVLISVNAKGYKPQNGHLMRFEISPQIDFTTLQVQQDVDATNWLSPQLDPGEWFVRVTVVRDGVAVSETSSPLGFTLQSESPAPQVEIDVEEPATNDELQFTWQWPDDPPAKGFQLQLALDEFEESSIEHPAESRELTLQVPQWLHSIGQSDLTEGHIRFRVRARLEQGFSPWSMVVSVAFKRERQHRWAAVFVPSDPDWDLDLRISAPSQNWREAKIWLEYSVKTDTGSGSVRTELGFWPAGDGGVVSLSDWSRGEPMWIVSDLPLNLSLVYTNRKKNWRQILPLKPLRFNQTHHLTGAPCDGPHNPVLILANHSREAVTVSVSLRLRGGAGSSLPVPPQMETQIEHTLQPLSNLLTFPSDYLPDCGSEEGAWLEMEVSSDSTAISILPATFINLSEGSVPIFIQ